MNEFMKKILILLLMLGALVIFTGCEKKEVKQEETTKKEEKKTGLVGTWEYAQDDFKMIMTFKDDKTGSTFVSEGSLSDEEKFIYKYDDKKIYLIYTDDEDKAEFELEYTLKDDKLTVTDNTDDTYTLTRKQKIRKTSLFFGKNLQQVYIKNEKDY